VAALHIGLDLDNTLIDYDDVFASVASEIGLLPQHLGLTTRTQVKAHLCAEPGGEEAWMRLQGQVYGRFIGRARLFEGVPDFFRAISARGAHVSIISHKTRTGHFDVDRIDLWQASLDWMKKHDFFSSQGFGLRPSSVHFHETRSGKIAAIATTGCELFVDDLPEVLRDQRFPRGVGKIWFAGNRAAPADDELVPYRNWAEILAAIGPLL
jgi:hypothetical protein